MLLYPYKTYAAVLEPETVAGKLTDKLVESKELHCVPAKTDLRGMGRVGSTNDLDVRISKDNALAEWVEGTKEKVKKVKSCDETPVDLTTDQIYRIKDGLGENRSPDRFGLTYGALVVPYKYHFNGSKSFGSNASVGPFVGYRFSKTNLGVSLKLVGFGGASAIKVDRLDENGEKKSDDIAAFSYGAGAIIVLKNEFQIGLILGADEVGNDTDYDDDGKLWAAVAIGFAFGT